MKTKLLSMCVAGASLGLMAGTAVADLISTFDSGDENWRFANDVTLSWQNANGNPGGFLQGKDLGDGRYWYYVSPQSWSGDWSVYTTLSFDIRVVSNSGGIAVYGNMVTIKGTNGDTLVWSGNAPSRSWTHYEIPLEPSTFGVNKGVFDSVMGNVSEIWIEGEYVSGSDTEGLDNVQLHSEVSEDCDTHATYSLENSRLTIPFMDLPLLNPETHQPTGEIAVFQAELKLKKGLFVDFTVLPYKLKFVSFTPTTKACHAVYSSQNKTLTIPFVQVDSEVYEATFKHLQEVPLDLDVLRLESYKYLYTTTQ